MYYIIYFWPSRNSRIVCRDEFTVRKEFSIKISKLIGGEGIVKRLTIKDYDNTPERTIYTYNRQLSLHQNIRNLVQNMQKE